MTKAVRHSCDYYVYGWYNFDWQRWFYIGKGVGRRYAETIDRSIAFREIVSSYYCEPRILVRGISEKDAIDVEQKTKSVLTLLGEPILDGEKSLSQKAQRAGIEIAKQQGKYTGRKPIEVDEREFTEQYRLWKAGETQPKYMMKRLGLKPATFYRKVKEYEDKHGITN